MSSSLSGASTDSCCDDSDQKPAAAPADEKESPGSPPRQKPSSTQFTTASGNRVRILTNKGAADAAAAQEEPIGAHHEMCISAADLCDLEAYRIISDKEVWDGGAPEKPAPELVDFTRQQPPQPPPPPPFRYATAQRRYLAAAAAAAAGGSMGQQSYTDVSGESGITVVKHENAANDDDGDNGADKQAQLFPSPPKYVIPAASKPGAPILLSTGQLFHTAFGDLHGYQLQQGAPPSVPQPTQNVMTPAPPTNVGGAVVQQQHANAEAQRKRELRLQKNREAARECRRKKKEYIKCLESRVAVLENQNKALIDELRQLKEPNLTNNKTTATTLKIESAAVEHE